MASTPKKFKPEIDEERLRLNVYGDENEKLAKINSGLYPTCSFTFQEQDGVERQMTVSYNELIKTQLLGKGGFGQVWKMKHLPSDIDFAVKIINESEMQPWNKKSVELEASKRIGHTSPYLISFYGALHVDSHIWLLTEPMDLSLERFSTVKYYMGLRIPDYFFSHVARSTLNGLAHMKSLKLIHRDVKPSNILMDSKGSVKLCDFGISGITKDSICNSYKGCQTYMAPEKLSISPEGYSIKSDIWSLAITLIEVATGRHPYSEISGGPIMLTAHIADEEPPSLDPTKFGEHFCDFIKICLTKDVDSRPGCRDLLDNHPFVDRNLTKKKKGYNIQIIKIVIQRSEALQD